MDIEPYTVFPRSKVGRDHQVRNQFRQGKVIDRKMDEKRGPLVRVQYLDKQGLISRWLPVKQFGSRATVHSYVPKIGDDVNVNMLPNGSADGFIDGSFFNENNPPPTGLDIDTRHYKTEDGTVIEYRETDSTFRLDVGGATARTGPRAGKAGGGAIVIVGDIQHTGNMTTSGVHTEANGIHMGGTERAEIDELRQRIVALEAEVQRIPALENEISKIKRRENRGPERNEQK
jgi:phage baseplate assembly protein V